MLKQSKFKSFLRDVFCGTNARFAEGANIVPVQLVRSERVRHYLMALPGQDTTGKCPLVIVLHGGGATAAQVLVGAQNADFEVAEVAWEFFKDKRAGLVPKNCIAARLGVD
jgi:hypothetical protein